MSLTLENVSFRYAGASHGLDDVSLKARQGELLAVMGRSGSGKSTVLRLVAGLLDGYRGRIAIGGDDVGGVPVWRRHVGMVFQQYALFPHLSVIDNVAYGLRMQGVKTAQRQRAALDMLSRVGLAEFAARRPTSLSGGQQQRVALARALAVSPRVLLLDEPLAALDAGIRQQLRDEIRALQQASGATTLIVTHDRDEALSLADRVAVIDNGRLLQIDTPQRLYDAPACATVASFTGLSTVLPARVARPGMVDTGFAELHVDTGAWRPGAAVSLLVRPEHIECDPPVSTLNRLNGHPGAVRFFGATCRFDFLPEGAPTPLLGESRKPASFAIALDPAHLRVLPPVVN
ncbi:MULTISPECIES: ABC transporter ATP-binding protein [Pandoraea]|uniref:ABC transporter ATP-binding protein n=1 Tax=Pandoraea TaxID=93217 RepID=UPI001F5D55B7|nr:MULTISPECIES: ABC transporter ATP-binding protein [Pandoraea]MCI3207931.1 ABC transporter ATP-binding protein [Pandoraea sp. LA3]MDN4585960.1 ABC transporter ATP-binding protein [Pandoraea capi]